MIYNVESSNGYLESLETEGYAISEPFTKQAGTENFHTVEDIIGKFETKLIDPLPATTVNLFASPNKITNGSTLLVKTDDGTIKVLDNPPVTNTVTLPVETYKGQVADSAGALSNNSTLITYSYNNRKASIFDFTGAIVETHNITTNSSFIGRNHMMYTLSGTQVTYTSEFDGSNPQLIQESIDTSLYGMLTAGDYMVAMHNAAIRIYYIDPVTGVGSLVAAKGGLVGAYYSTTMSEKLIQPIHRPLIVTATGGPAAAFFDLKNYKGIGGHLNEVALVREGAVDIYDADDVINLTDPPIVDTVVFPQDLHQPDPNASVSVALTSTTVAVPVSDVSGDYVVVLSRGTGDVIKIHQIRSNQLHCFGSRSNNTIFTGSGAYGKTNMYSYAIDNQGYLVNTGSVTAGEIPTRVYDITVDIKINDVPNVTTKTGFLPIDSTTIGFDTHTSRLDAILDIDSIVTRIDFGGKGTIMRQLDYKTISFAE